MPTCSDSHAAVETCRHLLLFEKKSGGKGIITNHCPISTNQVEHHKDSCFFEGRGRAWYTYLLVPLELDSDQVTLTSKVWLQNKKCCSKKRCYPLGLCMGTWIAQVLCYLREQCRIVLERHPGPLGIRARINSFKNYKLICHTPSHGLNYGKYSITLAVQYRPWN